MKETVSNDQQTTRAKSKTNPQSAILNPKLLTGDLDNIILKALRKEPSERYGSIQQFSEDISRFLRGLPILARPQTIKYRFGKYVKRHRVGVLAAALVLLSLVGGISVATWQAVVAHRERAKAEQRFSDVRRLANSVVFEFHDSIQNLPGSTPTRELLVSRALEYLDKLAAEDSDDVSLQLELAEAYDKIGDIQGGWRTSHLGKREQAEESYRKALSIREKLVSMQPQNINVRRGLAISYSKLSKILWVQVKAAECLEMARKSFEINRQLAEEKPTDTDIQISLATSQTLFGAFLATTNRFDESIDNLQQAIFKLESLAAQFPENDNVQEQLASSYYKIAEVFESLKQDFARALEYYRKAQIIHEKRLATNSENTEIRRNLGANNYAIANILQSLGDNKNALDNSQKSLLILSKLKDEDPQNNEFKEVVAAAEIQFASLLIKNGKAVEAVEKLEKPLGTLKELIANSPNNEIFKFRMAMIYEKPGNGYAALAMDKKTPNSSENWRTAREYFQKSYEIYKSFRDSGKTVGSDASVVDKIADEIAKCDAALNKKN